MMYRNPFLILNLEIGLSSYRIRFFVALIFKNDKKLYLLLYMPQRILTTLIESYSIMRRSTPLNDTKIRFAILNNEILDCPLGN